MPDVYSALTAIAASRRDDPLRPVTIVAPSHASALQLRRRLARQAPFAAVRFETFPRLAELIAGGHLTAQGRVPLARPIGDYLAQVVAAESGGNFHSVRDLPGYARTLRQIFTRLKRAGVRSAAGVHVPLSGDAAEILRLYDRFTTLTAPFHDIEDLLGAAAGVWLRGEAGVREDIGEVNIVPPGAATAAGRALIAALQSSGASVTSLDEPTEESSHRFTIAPDPASEAREIARAVIDDIEAGHALDEIAVFYGADRTYSTLLREAFKVAGVPAAPLPGIPLIETRAGRAVLLLADLPRTDYSRTSVIEFLSVAPLRERIPARDGVTRPVTTAWDNVSRNAGVTHGAETWGNRLSTAIAQSQSQIARLEAAQDDRRVAAIRFHSDQAATLQDVVQTLISRIEPLIPDQSAAELIDGFKGIVTDYLAPDAEALDEVLGEIDQLGTVGAVGGTFSLRSFAEALRANLTLACLRPVRMGDGVVIADYRIAAGMRFASVHLAGAYEGAFPEGPGVDAILDDRVWRSLKSEFPYIEDVQTRLDRARAAADRSVAAAGDGKVSWWSPAYQPGGNRDFYPAPHMVRAYTEATGTSVTASDLRAGTVSADVRRIASPLVGAMTGTPLDAAELGIRDAVTRLRSGVALDGSHPRRRSVDMLGARWSDRLTEFDGNIGEAVGGLVALPSHVSPTSLEDYATCGYRYFGKKVLRLNVVEEPAEQDTMAAATRGSLVHEALEKFFLGQHGRGRPQVGEFWTHADSIELLQIARRLFQEAKERGEAGYDLYAVHDLRTIEADLEQFLVEDNAFRQETRAIPDGFEVAVPATEVAGLAMRGYADRIDRTPDGKRAWVIDYKTGSTYGFRDIKETDPMLGGTKLQLPWYALAAEDADEIHALYWFISQRGEFKRVEYPPAPGSEERFRKTVEAIVTGIGSGVFPSVSGKEDEWRGSFDNCGFCDFKRICVNRRDIAFGEKMGDPAMAPWMQVGRAAREGLQ